jgi:hypothetical protein
MVFSHGCYGVPRIRSILFSVGTDRIEAEAPAVLVDREDQHQDEEEEIGPGPLALGIVEAEPQIEDLQRPDEAPDRHKDAKDQRTAVNTFSE